jgi:TPR repeat protein
MSRAFEYLNASAALGFPEAMTMLAYLYATGKHVPRNEPLALLYYTFAGTPAS